MENEELKGTRYFHELLTGWGSRPLRVHVFKKDVDRLYKVYKSVGNVIACSGTRIYIM